LLRREEWRMGSWQYLHHRAAVYLRDAAATRDPERRKQLIILAARCQEMIADLEQREPWTPVYPPSREELEALRARDRQVAVDGAAGAVMTQVSVSQGDSAGLEPR
jgi:hypothetical protein